MATCSMGIDAQTDARAVQEEETSLLSDGHSVSAGTPLRVKNFMTNLKEVKYLRHFE